MTYEIAHSAWNKGRIIGQKKPLKLQEVQLIRVALESEGRRRDCVMFELAIDSKLRGCDFVRLKVRDVFSNGRVFAIELPFFRERQSGRCNLKSAHERVRN
jgi:hypothetical protein